MKRIIIEIPDEAMHPFVHDAIVMGQYVHKVADQVEEAWDHGRVLPDKCSVPVDWRLEEDVTP